MIHKLLKLNKFIPTKFHQSVYDIDFEELKKQGKKLILSDLDNTLISYDEYTPTKQNIELFNKLKELDLELILLSNNVPSRIATYIENLELKGFANARKPLNIGVKKAVKSASKQYKKEEMVLIGDQLMTDVWCGNRYKIDTILVNPIKKKTEKWYTKFNRKTEVRMIERIKKEKQELFDQLNLSKRS